MVTELLQPSPYRILKIKMKSEKKNGEDTQEDVDIL